MNDAISETEQAAVVAAKRFVSAVAMRDDPMSNGTMGEFSENSRHAYEAADALYVAMRSLAVVRSGGKL